jgi:predicted AAA+ superfamily ATPase
LIDKKIAQFILTGSSARKLRRGKEINLLPGRLILFHVDPLMWPELVSLNPSLEQLLLYGSLPEILLESSDAAREENLQSYVDIYLEEEIRAEALVRQIGLFANFLELAASESGNIINIQKISQTLGVTRATIQHYFEILEDCLIAEKIEPLLKGSLRQRLSKSSKYLLFDLGIRRICAREGTPLPIKTMSNLFEQFIGLELLRQTRSLIPKVKICYWRDHNGPEVDYIIVKEEHLIPVEVKWSEAPDKSDIKHLDYFMKLYNSRQGYVICRTPKKMLLSENIMALPWQEISEIITQL